MSMQDRGDAADDELAMQALETAPIHKGMAEYVLAAFYSYEDIRDQRDDAAEQRDIARDWTVALEQENAHLLQELAAVKAVCVAAQAGDYATKGRDFGRGVAYMSELVLRLLA